MGAALGGWTTATVAAAILAAILAAVSGRSADHVGWVIVVVVVLAVLCYRAYAYDWRQIRERSRRHAAAGGDPRDAPDRTPGHGGGAAGA